jgi:hypothetical protein
LYGVLGRRLNLQSRKSYKIGVSKQFATLSTALWADGQRGRAVAAAVKAVGIAPIERKLRVGLPIMIAFTPTTYRFLGVLRHFMIIVDEQGLAALLDRAYLKLKETAFRIGSDVSRT